MNFADYERIVRDRLTSMFPGADISHNQILRGRISKTNRQIDILIQFKPGLESIIIIVDCKKYKRRLNVKDVEAFIGQMRDVGVERGMIFTTNGYSDAAYERAINDELDLELDVLSIESNEDFQYDAGVIRMSGYTVTGHAPIGWCVDDRSAVRMNKFIMCYQRGRAVQEALNIGEWIELDIVQRNSRDIDEITRLDHALINHLKRHTVSEFRSDSDRVELRSNEQTLLRVSHQAGQVAYANLLIQFDSFFGVLNLFSPERVLTKNLRKLCFFGASVGIERSKILTV